MAIVVLVLWLFTAGAGFYLLVTSNLGRARPARAPSASLAPPVGVAASGSAAASAGSAPPRAARDRFAPPSLVASRQAPIVPDLASVAEFAHPAFGITGLGFWLGFTLIHARVLGWIAFGLVVATACIGLAWFTANTRAARRRGAGHPAFTSRLILLHGGAAAVTLTLAALTALVLRG
ncbi:MAG TPA: hypothetical protein VME19_18470 [Streptosporangiaceae bacterium]|nr:hypothetical protein [Streptosporangiaceae bacterium]